MRTLLMEQRNLSPIRKPLRCRKASCRWATCRSTRFTRVSSEESGTWTGQRCYPGLSSSITVAVAALETRLCRPRSRKIQPEAPCPIDGPMRRRGPIGHRDALQRRRPHRRPTPPRIGTRVARIYRVCSAMAARTGSRGWSSPLRLCRSVTTALPPRAAALSGWHQHRVTPPLVEMRSSEAEAG